ncbi:MAG: REP-associated tyrosine transposase [Candidatus Binatota bacterium]|nr:REP-associated tyrosine transposase [Candidatus Binatota bacterium]
MARGIERAPIFRDDADRDVLLRKLASLTATGAWAVFAWAFMPNHIHLLVRTGARPLSRSMRSLLTFYAGYFNRRHARAGHLFQNRYKSVLCDEDAYFLELVRYIHLNPLRAGIVPTIGALDDYPYCGHSALIRPGHRSWQETTGVLQSFGTRPRDAIGRYRAFVRAAVDQGSRRDLDGGGLMRSNGGWLPVRELRRGREAHGADERILGSAGFVARVMEEMPRRHAISPMVAAVGFHQLVAVVREEATALAEILGDRRRTAAPLVREGLSYLWMEVLGRSGRALADQIGVSPSTVYKAAQRGRRSARRWQAVLGRLTAAK